MLRVLATANLTSLDDLTVDALERHGSLANGALHCGATSTIHRSAWGSRCLERIEKVHPARLEVANVACDQGEAVGDRGRRDEHVGHRDAAATRLPCGSELPDARAMAGVISRIGGRAASSASSHLARRACAPPFARATPKVSSSRVTTLSWIRLCFANHPSTNGLGRGRASSESTFVSTSILRAPEGGAAARATGYAKVSSTGRTDLLGRMEEGAPAHVVVVAFELLDRYDNDERTAATLDGLRLLARLVHQLRESRLCVRDTPTTSTG